MTKLEKIMRMNGLSKSKLAIRIGRNPNNLNSAWNGQCRWFPAWRRDISVLFNTSEDDLFLEDGSLREADDGTCKD